MTEENETRRPVRLPLTIRLGLALRRRRMDGAGAQALLTAAAALPLLLAWHHVGFARFVPFAVAWAFVSCVGYASQTLADGIRSLRDPEHIGPLLDAYATHAAFGSPAVPSALRDTLLRLEPWYLPIANASREAIAATAAQLLQHGHGVADPAFADCLGRLAAPAGDDSRRNETRELIEQLRSGTADERAAARRALRERGPAALAPLLGERYAEAAHSNVVSGAFTSALQFLGAMIALWTLFSPILHHGVWFSVPMALWMSSPLVALPLAALWSLRRRRFQQDLLKIIVTFGVARRLPLDYRPFPDGEPRERDLLRAVRGMSEPGLLSWLANCADLDQALAVIRIVEASGQDGSKLLARIASGEHVAGVDVGVREEARAALARMEARRNETPLARRLVRASAANGAADRLARPAQGAGEEALALLRPAERDGNAD